MEQNTVTSCKLFLFLFAFLLNKMVWHWSFPSFDFRDQFELDFLKLYQYFMNYWHHPNHYSDSVIIFLVCNITLVQIFTLIRVRGASRFTAWPTSHNLTKWLNIKFLRASALVWYYFNPFLIWCIMGFISWVIYRPLYEK